MIETWHTSSKFVWFLYVATFFIDENCIEIEEMRGSISFFYYIFRNKDNIVSTIKNWGLITYQSPILDHIWKLLPGFIIWKIWKERNKIFFHSHSSPPVTTWEKSLLSFRKPLELDIGHMRIFNEILHKFSSR